MSKPTLDSIATAKARLSEELRKLEEQEVELRQQQSNEAYTENKSLVGQYAQHFSAKQRSEIAVAVASTAPTRGKKDASAKEVAPKYWLPHTQETWTGRGRPPRSFTAWEGTAAYKEWKSKHPNEKFPKYSGYVA